MATPISRIWTGSTPSVRPALPQSDQGVISIGKGVSYHSDISKRAKTALEQETDDRRDDCNERKGNPVVLYTGNKVEIERDFTVNGEMGLYLERTYNHH